MVACYAVMHTFSIAGGQNRTCTQYTHSLLTVCGGVLCAKVVDATSSRAF